MQSIEDKLQLKKKYAIELCKRFENIFARYIKTDNKSYTINKSFNDNIKILTADIQIKLDTIENCANTFLDIFQMDDALIKFFISLKALNDNINTTNTTSLQTTKEYNIMELIKNKYDNIEIDYNLIFNQFNKEDLFKFILNYNLQITPFISFSINRLIEESPDKNKLKLHIDSYIDNLFCSHRTKLTDKGIMSMIVRYNLKPHGPSISLNELFKMINSQHDLTVADVVFPDNFDGQSSIVDNLLKLTTGQVGIIYINFGSKTNIEFNYDGLINEQFIKDNTLNIPKTVGLNLSVLKRFNTIFTKQINSTPSEIQFLPDKSKPQWRIILTQNGIDFCFLTYLNNTIIESEQILGLINGITSRPIDYTENQLPQILNNCYDKKMTHYLNKYSNLNPSRNASQIISSLVLDKFKQISYDIVLETDNYKEIESKCTNINMITKVITSAIKSISTEATNTEILLTQLSKMNDTINVFRIELNKTWRNNKMKVNMPKKYIIDHCINNFILTINEVNRIGGWETKDLSLKDFMLTNRV